MLIKHDKYICYYIQTKHKKKRLIQEPIPDLKLKQKLLVQKLESFPLLPECTSKKGKNLLDNANPHIYGQYLLKIDIANCFPSITMNQVINSLIENSATEYIEEVKTLGFVKNKYNVDVLPTGAPSSPILCNIALTQLDKDILKIIKDKNIVYTRYIDDLTFSMQTKCPELKFQVIQLLQTHKLKPNWKKIRWFSKHKADKFIVTGVNLKGKNRLPRSFARMLRAKLANLAKEKKQIDPEAQGCLSYVRQIDPKKYQYFIEYYQQRMQYENIATGISPSFK